VIISISADVNRIERIATPRRYSAMANTSFFEQEYRLSGNPSPDHWQRRVEPADPDRHKKGRIGLNTL
jgi:hypothetical protein